MKRSWKLSPAAGRFSGVNNTKGKYVLIIDGDMELLNGWIEKGLEFLENKPKVASVVGKQYYVYCQNESQFVHYDNLQRKDAVGYLSMEQICHELILSFYFQNRLRGYLLLSNATIYYTILI